MTKTTLAPLIVLLLSLALLIPGITQPLITLQASMSHQALVDTGQTLVQQQDMHPAMKSMASQFLSSLECQWRQPGLRQNPEHIGDR